jgi:chromosome segregation ATPase
MTDSDRSLSEVPGLIEERRRYEGWLSALEARRESTPKHVFERVQSDYRTRLQRVAEQLASYKQAIDEECASVQARIALLEAEEQLQRDERAELELRAHVGELSREDASGSFDAVDRQIERLVSEKATLAARVGELQCCSMTGRRRPRLRLKKFDKHLRPRSQSHPGALPHLRQARTKRRLSGRLRPPLVWCSKSHRPGQTAPRSTSSHF